MSSFLKSIISDYAKEKCAFWKKKIKLQPGLGISHNVSARLYKSIDSNTQAKIYFKKLNLKKPIYSKDFLSSLRKNEVNP